MKRITSWTILRSAGMLCFVAMGGLLGSLHFSWASDISASEAKYGMQGQLEIRSLGADGHIRHSGDYGFAVDVSGKQWLIKISYAPQHYQICGCDGTNIYSYLADERSHAGSSYPATIMRGTYPFLLTYHFTVPWYALVFQPNAPENSSLRMPAPWHFAGVGFLADCYEVHPTLLREKPYLCDNIDFCFSYQALAHPLPDRVPISVAGGVHMPTSDELKSNYADGQIVATYHILSSTNWAGMTFPLQFEFSYENHPGMENASSSRLVMIGTVSRVGPPSVSSFVPVIPKRLDVTDYRLKDLSSGSVRIQYSIEHESWPDEKSPRLRAVMRSSSLHQRYVTRPYYILLILLGGSLLLLVITVALRWVYRASREGAKG